ncbi:uncharacterized protein LOC129609539 [Condylostylus longicornis]|uniref:uncharacterized protein LOC129609539 n=1 Tax=Condylostylus longicornis TaxID=2530218 RepID=UPI00244E434A|nr:uncharacterized protein LOC129609539 [Condylostylus longicornis]
MIEIKNLFLLISLFGLVILSNCQQQHNKKQDIWEKDLTDSFKLDGSDQGIQRVNLKCGAESMHVTLETEKEFTGVMYTRGSFYKKVEPCFTKPITSRGSRSLEMKFNFDQCQTLKDGDVFSNIVVIQNDPELITPGDAAFSLECDFRRPRNLQVQSEFQAKDRTVYGSRITFASPDPSEIKNEMDKYPTVHNNTDTVTYVPNTITQEKSRIKVMGSVEDISLEIKIKESLNEDNEKIIEKDVKDEL